MTILEVEETSEDQEIQDREVLTKDQEVSEEDQEILDHEVSVEDHEVVLVEDQEIQVDVTKEPELHALPVETNAKSLSNQHQTNQSTAATVIQNKTNLIQTSSLAKILM